jgi:CBS domain-containing protein
MLVNPPRAQAQGRRGDCSRLRHRSAKLQCETTALPKRQFCRENPDMETSLHLHAERADGATIETYLPLSRGGHPARVTALLDTLLTAGAEAKTADLLAALAMALALATLKAHPGRHSLDRTLALVEDVLNAARDTEDAMNRKVADIIKRQKLAKLGPTATVRAACKLMAERDIGAVMVTDAGGHLAGIFTERDLVKRVAGPGLDIDATKLKDVMTPAPQTMRPSDAAVLALRRMRDGGFRHMPVVDEGKLLGIVSSRDFLGAEMKQLEIETAFRSAAMAEGFRPNA